LSGNGKIARIIILGGIMHFDFKAFFNRIKDLLFKPNDTWNEIKGEETNIKDFLLSYVLIIAAVPAISQFLGYFVVGGLFRIYNLHFFKAILNSVIVYIFSVASIYLTAFIMDQLAVQYGGQKNLNNSIKLIAYSMTPYWIASVLYIIPPLAPVSFLAAIYGFFIMYLGIPILIEVPKEKSFLYLIITIIILVVINVILILITNTFFAVHNV